jgi:hypothetical protein
MEDDSIDMEDSGIDMAHDCIDTRMGYIFTMASALEP